MRLLTAGSLVRAQQGEPVGDMQSRVLFLLQKARSGKPTRRALFFVPAFFFLRYPLFGPIFSRRSLRRRRQNQRPHSKICTAVEAGVASPIRNRETGWIPLIQ